MGPLELVMWTRWIFKVFSDDLTNDRGEKNPCTKKWGFFDSAGIQGGWLNDMCHLFIYLFDIWTLTTFFALGKEWGGLKTSFLILQGSFKKCRW